MKDKNKPSYLQHRHRIKEKYKLNGFSGWLEYEILEYILFYAIPQKDTKLIAKELLRRFKTIKGVLDANENELEEVSGISKHSSLFLKMFKDISKIYLENEIQRRDVLSTPHAVVDYFKTVLGGAYDEELRVLFLDNGNKLIKAEVIQKGTVNQSVVYPRKIVERALYHHAVSIILAHNHPGGTLNPSQEDKSVTQRVKSALQTVDISLLDHIIIGSNEGYFSFREIGLL